MKTIAMLLCLFLGCTEEKRVEVTALSSDVATVEDKPIYHIKVKPFGDNYWCVVFKNDDFLTEKPINKTFDLTQEYGEIKVVHQVDLMTKHQAICLAKTLTSYQMCLDYNARIRRRYEKILRLRQQDPPKQKTIENCPPQTEIIIQ